MDEHTQGEVVHLLAFGAGKWPEGELAPTRYWLAHLPKKKVALVKLTATAKARWRVEQD